MGENVSALDKEDRCKFSTYGYACGKHVEHGRYLCEEHAKATCASCGQPATHGCDFCGQFVCGTPLCDECTFGTDDSKPSGAWGFMNHIHVSRPEFADKHENRRLKEENAALARQAEALQQEVDSLKQTRQHSREASAAIHDAFMEERKRVEALQRENADLREALKPFVSSFEARRHAYSKRYSDRDLGYANFDKMPDEWAMEHISFNMGVFRRARALLGGSENAE